MSLHVRRGDYANNPSALSTHGLCSLDYYREAVNHIAEKVKEPHFFIFSDDMDWAVDNIRIKFPCEYIDHNKGPGSSEDMRLMSLCRSHIIANSSFSWWGAWLNPDPTKIVVAPKRWFARNVETPDLIPDGWVRI